MRLWIKAYLLAGALTAIAFFVVYNRDAAKAPIAALDKASIPTPHVQLFHFPISRVMHLEDGMGNNTCFGKMSVTVFLDPPSQGTLWVQVYCSNEKEP